MPSGQSAVFGGLGAAKVFGKLKAAGVRVGHGWIAQRRKRKHARLRLAVKRPFSPPGKIAAPGGFIRRRLATNTTQHNNSTGKATTGLVLGIIGMFAWFIPILGLPPSV